jgi:2-polyprenyl-6-methoxyphenol hydroxylase-like FAD-dependent oxidoreductase
MVVSSLPNGSVSRKYNSRIDVKWLVQELPSPNEWRAHILEHNDGSMPREPYQRCSQAIFEAWLKPHIQAEPLIESIFGLKFVSLAENDTGVKCELIDQSGTTHLVSTQYVIGCDGAGSKVRASIGGTLSGGPV